MKPKLTRKDRCHLVGKRMVKLTNSQAACSWQHLSGAIGLMGEPDFNWTPKFNDLLKAIRRATIFGSKCKL